MSAVRKSAPKPTTTAPYPDWAQLRKTMKYPEWQRMRLQHQMSHSKYERELERVRVRASDRIAKQKRLRHERFRALRERLQQRRRPRMVFTVRVDVPRKLRACPAEALLFSFRVRNKLRGSVEAKTRLRPARLDVRLDAHAFLELLVIRCKSGRDSSFRLGDCDAVRVAAPWNSFLVKAQADDSVDLEPEWIRALEKSLEA